MSTFAASPTDAFENVLRKGEKSTDDSRFAATPDISVVVPTYKRPAMLERCLASILTQDYDPARFEIIVCDDGPDDATRATVERIAHERAKTGPRVRYLPVTRSGWRT